MDGVTLRSRPQGAAGGACLRRCRRFNGNSKKWSEGVSCSCVNTRTEGCVGRASSRGNARSRMWVCVDGKRAGRAASRAEAGPLPPWQQQAGGRSGGGVRGAGRWLALSAPRPAGYCWCCLCCCRRVSRSDFLPSILPATDLPHASIWCRSTRTPPLVFQDADGSWPPCVSLGGIF